MDNSNLPSWGFENMPAADMAPQPLQLQTHGFPHSDFEYLPDMNSFINHLYQQNNSFIEEIPAIQVYDQFGQGWQLLEIEPLPTTTTVPRPSNVPTDVEVNPMDPMDEMVQQSGGNGGLQPVQQSTKEKSSNHSFCQEYSEEIPPQSQSYYQRSQPSPSQSTSYVHVQQQSPFPTKFAPSQNTLNENAGFQQIPETQEQNSPMVELNRQLLKEVAKLRIFIKAQKIRIDTLVKQNGDLRNDVNELNFQKEYADVKRVLDPLVIQAQNGTFNSGLLPVDPSLIQPNSLPTSSPSDS